MDLTNDEVGALCVAQDWIAKVMLRANALTPPDDEVVDLCHDAHTALADLTGYTAL